MITIGTRCKNLLYSTIVMVVLSSLFIVGSIIGAVLLSKAYPDASNSYLIILIVFGLAMAGLDVWQIVLLAKICSCPQVLISREGDMFHLYIGKGNTVALPCEQVLQVGPVAVMMTASLLGMMTDKYDAALKITTTDGRVFKVPYVRLAKQVSEEMARIIYEVRARKGISVVAAPQQ